MKLYQPSSGSEGAWFMSRFCDLCKRDAAFRDGTGDSCPIAADTMVYSVDDPEYPREWIEDESGPRCTAFEPEESLSSTTGTGEAVVVSPAGGA
jgi:hypothetical protein